jgi:hypothetical protein
MLQFDLLVIHSIIAKIMCWAVTAAWLYAAYANRKKYVTIRVPK